MQRVEEGQGITAPEKFPNTFWQTSALPAQAVVGRSQEGRAEPAAALKKGLTFWLKQPKCS